LLEELRFPMEWFWEMFKEDFEFGIRGEAQGDWEREGSSITREFSEKVL
jgi:hypothetical protein